MTRLTTIALLFGVIIAGVLYDRVERTPQPVPDEAAARSSNPMLSSPASLTSAWYCPIGISADQQVVVISNLADEPAVGTIELMTSDGPGPSLRFDLSARGSESILLSEVGEGPRVGALVEIVGGEAVVGHQISTSAGSTEGPCLTSTSDEWFFAGGSTTRDRRELIALLNPSFDDVVFTAEFTTIGGRVRTPQDLRAAVVPARSVRVIEVGEFVARESLFSTTIRTAQGRLAVERLQIVDGTLGPAGTSLTLGVDEPSTEWMLLGGRLHDNSNATVVVSNPTDELAEVDVFLVPNDPADRASFGLVPEELTIRPGRSVALDLIDLATRVGLPLPFEMGVRIVSANDVPVVAERWQLDPAIDESLIGGGGENARVVARFQDGDENEVPEEELAPESIPDIVAVQPTPDRGVSASRGVAEVSTRWVIPVVSLPVDGVTTIVVGAGDEDAAVEVRLLVGGTFSPPMRVTVPAESRTMIPVSSPASAATVVITSDSPVWAEGVVVVPGSRADIVAAIPTRTAE